MKKESDKSILDKLDEIGSPIRNILEGTEGEYKGFVPIEMLPLKNSSKPKSVHNKKKKIIRKNKRKSRKRRR